MAVNKRPTFGGIFFWGAYLPQKSDILPPFLATIQRLSKARVFLLRLKISEGCFVSDAPPAISRPYLIIETNSWKIRGYCENRCKVLPARVIFSLNTLIIWYSTRMTVAPSHGLLISGLVWWNSPGFESSTVQRIIYLEASFFFFHCPKIFHLLLLFSTACFLLVKNTR
jgi:hypothetical protein